MDDSFFVDGLQGKAYLEEEPPNFAFTEFHQRTFTGQLRPIARRIIDTVLGNRSTKQNWISHVFESSQVLREVATLTVLHNEVELVALGDERVDVFADVLMTDIAHQTLLLLGGIQRIWIFKWDFLHHVNVVVD